MGSIKRRSGPFLALDGKGTSIRVGVDLASIADVASSIATFGDRYLWRIFTDHELSTCGHEASASARLAARFAAKEAVMKVLEPGDEALDWRSIEVNSQESGACRIRLFGAAQRAARRARIGELAVSLTHEGPLAAAVVVAWLRPNKPRRSTGLASLESIGSTT